MRKLLLTTAAVLALATPALAGSGFSFGTGFNAGHVQTATTSTTNGLAAGAAVANGTNTSVGAGFATTTPAGGLSAGVGAAAGTSNAASGAFSIGPGTAATGATSNNAGIGVGLGFTNTTP